MLNQPVLPQLEEEVLGLIEAEGVVVPTVEIPHLALLLCNLRRGARAWVGVGSLQPELW